MNLVQIEMKTIMIVSIKQNTSNWGWNDTIIALSITSFLIIIIAITKQAKLLNNTPDNNGTKPKDHSTTLQK